MAEEEDDYMGDLSQYLPPQPSIPFKPSSRKVSNTKPQITQPPIKKPKFQNWQEEIKLKREKTQSQEDQQTIANIQSAIPQSNIGFKMLQQMGYTPGSALGKEGSGRVEPVGIEIRRGRGGIGREDPRKEKMRREEERMRREEERLHSEKRREGELMEEFGWRKKEAWRKKRVVVNFQKAKGVLDQLENKEVVEVAKKDDDDEENEEKEEEEEVITEEDLLDILMKLRDEHQYCLFCGCKYESTESLLSNCPGIDEDDH